jgi:hypothetical protein
MHLFLNLSFAVHGSGEGKVHIVRVIFSDINILHSLPINTIANWLPCGPKGRKWIKPLI